MIDNALDLYPAAVGLDDSAHGGKPETASKRL